MGLFSNSSPFDADIDKATDGSRTSEDWGLILDICDKVGTLPNGPKDCMHSVMRRLNDTDPHVAMNAITLLDACVNNCGKNFHLEIASREFESEYRKLVTKAHPKVREKLGQLLKKWAEGDFKSDPQLNLIPSLYNKLRQEGMDFSAPSEVKKTAVSKDPNVVSSAQEEEDIAKAIEMSLKETQSSPKVKTSLYPVARAPSPTGGSPKKDSRKVRALYDFQAVEDNELTFKAGEIVHVTDDSDPNWWKGNNQRGEGLFPANFVTSDLTAEPEQFKVEQQKKSVQFSEEVQVKTVDGEEEAEGESIGEVTEIDAGKLDRLLQLLHEADPTGERKETGELVSLEEQCQGMAPLIDQELEQIDRRHAQLSKLGGDLQDALNMYHTLMREMPHPPQFMPPQQFGPVPKGFPPQFMPPHHHMGPQFSGGFPPQFIPPQQMDGGPPPPPHMVGMPPPHFQGMGMPPGMGGPPLQHQGPTHQGPPHQGPLQQQGPPQQEPPTTSGAPPPLMHPHQNPQMQPMVSMPLTSASLPVGYPTLNTSGGYPHPQQQHHPPPPPHQIPQSMVGSMPPPTASQMSAGVTYSVAPMQQQPLL